MPLGKKPQHRLRIEDGQMVVEQENKQGFVRGMIGFYGRALGSAKNKLKNMVKERNKGSGHAFYDNSDYRSG